ncbi:hypothetical protein L3X38_027995 [Prunus dulcis]|uniref:Uncharacterized protein n=1 Tax=Prunus dulcis TaxID=3755 RepID=A0AAD4Z1N2_PRUDU|nr:hypothetical protein L3X38_027995 [Prunus dulcis]
MFLNVLNVITNTLWGGTVEGDERAGLGAEFREVVSEMTELLGKPNVSDFYPGLARFNLQGIEKQMARRFDGIFEKLKDEGGDSKTPFTMTHVKALLMDMVVGGSDTSSNTVEFALAEIMHKPEVMKKAQQELEAVVGKH